MADMSLRVARSLKRMRRGLLWAAAVVVAVGVALALLVSPHPWLSVLLGLGVSLVAFEVSYWTTTKSAGADIPHVGWVALDYVVKIALAAGALITAKYVEGLNLYVVAALVILGFVVGMIVQVWAFLVPAKPE